MSNPTIFSFDATLPPSNSIDQSNLLNYSALCIVQGMTDAKFGSTEPMKQNRAMPFVYVEETGYTGRQQVLVIFASYAMMDQYNTAALQAFFGEKHVAFVGYLKAYEFLKEQSWNIEKVGYVPFYVKSKKEPYLFPVRKERVTNESTGITYELHFDR